MVLADLIWEFGVTDCVYTVTVWFIEEVCHSNNYSK